MRGYREVFRPAEGQPADPGKIFYTITEADVGNRHIKTTAGTLSLADVIGRVQAIDVGKRLYRVRCEDPAGGWIWQCENERQRDERLAREAARTGPVHKAMPGDRYGYCGVCGQRINRVPGGQGVTWIHSDSGTVAAPNPPEEA